MDVEKSNVVVTRIAEVIVVLVVVELTEVAVVLVESNQLYNVFVCQTNSQLHPTQR